MSPFTGEKKPRSAGLVSLVVVDLGNRCQPSKSTTRTKTVAAGALVVLRPPA